MSRCGTGNYQNNVCFSRVRKPHQHSLPPGTPFAFVGVLNAAHRGSAAALSRRRGAAGNASVLPACARSTGRQDAGAPGSGPPPIGDAVRLASLPGGPNAAQQSSGPLGLWQRARAERPPWRVPVGPTPAPARRRSTAAPITRVPEGLLPRIARSLSVPGTVAYGRRAAN
jgi:hypothetical protein